MPVPDYDNLLVGQYIRAIENPDSVGYNNGRWYPSPRRGDDPNNRGFGVDIKYNNAARKLTEGRKGKWLSEEEERNLRNKHINYSEKIVNKWTPKILAQPPSEAKKAMAIGMVYRGDGVKSIIKNEKLRDAYYEGTDDDFEQAVSDFYNSKRLRERAKNHAAFMDNRPSYLSSIMDFETQELPPLKSFSNGGELKDVDWNSLPMAQRAEVVKLAVENGIYNIDTIRNAYNEFAKGGHIYDGTTEASQQMNTPTFWGGTLPEVEVAAPRKWFVGYDENANPIYTTDYKQSQEYLQNQIPLSDLEQSRRQWAFENKGANGQVRPGLHGDAADLASAAELGIGTALSPFAYKGITGLLSNPIADAALTTDGVINAPSRIKEGIGDISNGDYGSAAWNLGTTALDILGGANLARKATSLVKSRRVPKSIEMYSIPSNYTDESRSVYEGLSKQKLNQLLDDKYQYDPQKFNKNIDKFYQNDIIVTEDPIDTFFKGLDMDKRFKFIPSGKFVNYDPYSMTVEEVEKTFGPVGKNLKEMLDIAKAHNFEGKYGKLAKTWESEFEKLFPILKTDPDVAIGLEKARRLYSIPEYRQRFNKIAGTLGDTFVDDALDRLENVRLQGVNGDIGGIGEKIKAAGTTHVTSLNPRSPLIKIKNTDSSESLRSVVQHEAGHASHGTEVLQPGWMKRHNEAIKPKLKTRYQNSDDAVAKYQDRMDEIITRSKTTIEYADEIRKPGESLDDALERAYKEAEKVNSKAPTDTKDLVWYFDKETLLNFWKNFVGGIVVTGGSATANIGKSIYDDNTENSNIYASGGKIHIKPENRGKFTALKKRTGHSASWFKAHGTPAQRKMATFALNARKWKHGDGGEMDVYDEPQTFAGSMVEALGASPSTIRGADVVSSFAQMTPFGHYVAATDLGRDLNRVYHGEEGAKKDALIDVISMIPGISAPRLKAKNSLWNKIIGNDNIRRSLNTGIITGKIADFTRDTWGANKTSKELGGILERAREAQRRKENPKYSSLFLLPL